MVLSIGQHLLVGGFIIVADAFGASAGIDLINPIPHRNRLIWAFRFAHIAVDTFLGYQQCHFSFLSILAPGQAHNLT